MEYNFRKARLTEQSQIWDILQAAIIAEKKTAASNGKMAIQIRKLYEKTLNKKWALS